MSTTTEDDFFANAPEDYEVPSGGGRFMKLAGGENKFRILERPIFGWEAWLKTTDPAEKKKAVRFRLNEKPTDLRAFKDNKVEHFWAMPVWNFATKTIEILQIKQKGVLSAIETLARSADWGSPLNYTIVVKREGTTKDDTKYFTNPVPPQPLPAEIAEAFAKVKTDGFDMQELYKDGGDPFAPNHADLDAVAEAKFDGGASQAAQA